MKVLRSWIAGLLLVGAASGYAAGAEAATLKFTGTGVSPLHFTMDSDPTPSDSTSGLSIDITGASVQGPGIDYVRFFSGPVGGAMNVFAPGGSFLQFFGAQLYTGPESAPHFAPGIFSLTNDKGAAEQLVVSATPIPAAMPLFASALGALGLIGWRRRECPPVGA